MTTEAQLVSITLGGGIRLFHKKTGKPIHLVREFTGQVETLICDECGATRRERIYRYRRDKRYNPENIEERKIPPTIHHVPVYED